MSYIQKIKKMWVTRILNQALLKILKGHYHHYDFILPPKLGVIGNIGQLFHKIPATEKYGEPLKELPEDAIIVIVSVHPSLLELLLSFHHMDGLHRKRFSVVMGFPSVCLNPFILALRISLVSLYHWLGSFFMAVKHDHPTAETYILSKGGGYITLNPFKPILGNKPDPLHSLVLLQEKVKTPIYLVPQIVFYGKKSSSYFSIFDHVFGSKENPGKLRKLTKLIFKPKEIFVELSNPLCLSDYISKQRTDAFSPKHLSLLLQRDLLYQIRRHRQSITGPKRKSRDEIKFSTLANADLQCYIESYSERKKIKRYVVQNKVRRYIDEIAAEYNTHLFGGGIRMIDWFFNSVFDGVTVNDEAFEQIKKSALKGPVIFVPCHRSHLDSIVLLYALYTHNFSIPLSFAGKNLDFWPIGPALRWFGAFFVRRSFKGAALYTKVFNAYIRTMLKEGFHINVFIEGTRSRSGKLLPPKLGMLKILIDAWVMGACKDLVFVPVFIGYDRVPEESAYLAEANGAAKEPESLRQIVKARKMFKKRYGKIHVKFNESFSIRQWIDENGLPSHNITSKHSNLVCRKIGQHLMTAINDCTILTPQALVASAMLNHSKKIRNFTDIMEQVRVYLMYISHRGFYLSDALLSDYENSITQTIQYYNKEKMIHILKEGGGQWALSDRFQVVTQKKQIFEYYKNSCVLLFIPAAFTALSILNLKSFQFSNLDVIEAYRFLSTVFQSEFLFNEDPFNDDSYQETIKFFTEDAILVPHQSLLDTYRITSSGYRKLFQFAKFIEVYLETYLILMNYLLAHPDASKSNGKRSGQLVSFGNKMHKVGEIENKEAAYKFMFQNANTVIKDLGLKKKGAPDKDQVMRYKQKLESYIECLRQF